MIVAYDSRMHWVDARLRGYFSAREVARPAALVKFIEMSFTECTPEIVKLRETPENENGIAPGLKARRAA